MHCLAVIPALRGARAESVELEESATGLGHCATRACRFGRVPSLDHRNRPFSPGSPGPPGHLGGDGLSRSWRRPGRCKSPSRRAHEKGPGPKARPLSDRL